jgi:hypothetical protein
MASIDAVMQREGFPHATTRNLDIIIVSFSRKRKFLISFAYLTAYRSVDL